MRLTILLIALAAVAAPAQGQRSPAHRADSAAVHAAALDYVEAIYAVQPERIVRSVDSALVKYGYSHDANGAERGSPMTFAQLVRLAETWNRDGTRAGPRSPKEIRVYDVQDRTASVKLTAQWGTDYMLLAKTNGQWKIRHILWQTPPRSATPAARATSP